MSSPVMGGELIRSRGHVGAQPIQGLVARVGLPKLAPFLGEGLGHLRGPDDCGPIRRFDGHKVVPLRGGHPGLELGPRPALVRVHHPGTPARQPVSPAFVLEALEQVAQLDVVP